MKHEIQLTSSVVTIDEASGLSDMQSNCPLFFKTKHGKRETYTVHRGCLIVRGTTTFDRQTGRMTSVFLYLPEGFPDSKVADFFCVSAGCNLASVKQAKRLIDRIIAEKRYEYGMPPLMS